MEQEYRILIAEDTPSDVFLEEREIKKAFKKYQIRVVETREDFINALQEFQPDIILSDYNMPTFNGLSALKITIEKAPLIPFILVTGSVNEETAVECMKAGAIDYIIKEHVKRLGPAMINALQQKKVKLEKIAAENLLEENEKMYRLMFERNPQLMFIYDIETMAFLEVNEAALNHYGYTLDEFKSMTIKDIRPPEEVEKLLKYTSERNEKNSFAGEWRHIKKDGSEINVEIFSHFITHNNRPARHVMVTDITKRKKIEEDLRISEEKYRTFFENVQDVFYYIDLNGIIRDISPSIRYFSEFTREEIIGRPVVNLYSQPQQRDIFLQKLLENKEVREYEILLKNKAGDIRVASLNARLIIDDEGMPHHIEGALRDITERKNAEKKLLESENRFRSLFENNISVMLLIEPETGKIIDANKSAVKYYGWTLQQLTNMRIQDINTLGEDLKPELDKAIAQNQIYFEFEHRRADGTKSNVEIFSSKIEIQGKVYLHSIIHDVTTRKQAEQSVVLLSRAIEQSPISVMITNRDGELVYVNPKFTEITGYSLEEIIGKTPSILKSGEHTVDFYKNIWDTILLGKEWHGEFLNKRKNGELYWDKSVISSINNSEGEISYFIAVQEDITEYKQLNAELIKAKEKTV